MPLFEQHGIDLLLSGHDHCYERTWPLLDDRRAEGGITHVVSGGGGAVLYPVGRSEWTAVSESAFHYVIMKAEQDWLHVDVYDIEDREIDAFTLVKRDNVVDAAERAAPIRTGLPDHLRFLGRTTDRKQRSRIEVHAGSKDVETRRAVAEALSRLSSGASIPVLSRLSRDPDDVVRKWAARGLAYVDDQGTTAPLIARLTDSDPDTRRFAAIGLRFNPTDAAVAPLVRSVTDENAHVREAVVQTLAFYQQDAARRAIVGRVSDSVVAVRRMAVSAIIEEDLGKRAVVELAAMLPRESDDEKVRILEVLGGSGDVRAVDAIVSELESGSVSVRRRAVIELGSLKSDLAVPALIDRLEDQDKGVRLFAWRALRVITGERLEDDVSVWRAWNHKR